MFSHFVRLRIFLLYISPELYAWFALYLYKGEHCLRDVILHSVTKKSHLDQSVIFYFGKKNMHLPPDVLIHQV